MMLIRAVRGADEAGFGFERTVGAVASVAGGALVEVLHRGDAYRSGKSREEMAGALDRYELARASEQTFNTSSP